MRRKAEDKRLKKAVLSRIREVLLEARGRLKLTQEDVAERIGMNPKVYGRLEREGFVPRVPTLLKLSVALGVSVDRLIGLDDGRTASVLPQKELKIPEEELPPETRRALRAVRKLSSRQLKALCSAAHALAAVKGKRSKRSR